MSKRRHQSTTGRYVAGAAARKERDAVPRNEFTDDPVTGQYTGKILDEKRAERPTDVRLKRLEDDRDEMRNDLNAIKVNVGKIGATADTLLKMTAEERDARQHRENLEMAREASRRSLVVPIIKAIGVALAVIAAAVVGHGV